MLQRKSWRKKEQEWERERQEWSQLLVLWQGTKHLHYKDHPQKRVTAPGTHTCPPPYAPPALGVYPVSTFYIEKGTMNIETPEVEEEGETPASIFSIPAKSHSTTYSPVSMNMTQPAKPSPSAPVRTISAPNLQPSPRLYPPLEEYHEVSQPSEFADRQIREFGQEAARLKQDSQEHTQTQINEAEQLRQKIEQTKQELEKTKRKLMRQKERCEVVSPPVAGEGLSRAHLKAEGQWESDKTTELQLGLDLELTKLDLDSVEDLQHRQHLDDLLQKDCENAQLAYEHLNNQKLQRLERRTQIEPVANALRTPVQPDNSMRLRSGRSLGVQPLMMAPLMAASPGQPQKYKPFSFGDVQAMVDKLPPVTDGGSLWLSKLDALTAGHTLALGDFRAVAARSMTPTNLRDIETDALTLRLSDDTSFLTHCTNIGAAMRIHFPLPNSSAMPKITWDSKQNPRQFLSDAKDTWTTQTGLHPGNKGSQAEWFRQAVLNGVPDSVQKAMKNNPDMLGCQLSVWEKHLVHHLTTAQDKTEKEEKEQADLQAQLLRLQLAKARDEVNDKRKNKKDQVKIMAQILTMGDDSPQFPDLSPTPPWVPHHRHGGGLNRGRGGPRGVGRKGFSGGRPQNVHRVCFLCGDPSHWMKECPHNPINSVQGRQHQRGRGGMQPMGGRADGVNAPYPQCPLWHDTE